MSIARLVCGYRLLYAALIVVASVQTLWAAQGVPHVVPLAAAEIAGALLIAWRPTQVPGLAILLGVFAAAQAMEALHGSWPVRFLLYAASALLIVLIDRALRAAPAPAAPI